MKPHEYLGELLVETGVLEREKLKAALTTQKKSKKRIGETLVELGYISDTHLAQALSAQLGFPYLDVSNSPVDPEAVKLLSESLAARHTAIPVSIVSSNLVKMAMSDPMNIEVIRDLEFATGRGIVPVVAATSSIREAISRHYGQAVIPPETLKEIQSPSTYLTGDLVPKWEEKIRTPGANPAVELLHMIV